MRWTRRGHYQRWQQDFELAREIGVTHLRYGPPLHLIFDRPGPLRLGLDRRADGRTEPRGPEPIVDLCHFGLPDWLGNFQNPDIARGARRICAALRRALSVGALLYAGQRDVCLRADERAGRPVERAAARRGRLRHRRVQPRRAPAST